MFELCRTFQLSSDFGELRQTGKRALGVRNLLTEDEFLDKSYLLGDRQEWRDYLIDVGVTAEYFGLSTDAALRLCLVKGFDPETWDGQIEARPARLVFVTEADEGFEDGWVDVLTTYVAVLLGEVDRQLRDRGEGATADRLGMTLVRKYPCTPLGGGDSEEIIVRPDLNAEFATDSWAQVSIDRALRVQVESPPNYPPELARKLLNVGVKYQRKILKDLGYDVRVRLRRVGPDSLSPGLKPFKNRGRLLSALQVATEMMGVPAKNHPRIAKLVRDRRHRAAIAVARRGGD
nr:hypothetical protein 5 [Desulfobacterales bacterium]